MAQQKRSHLRAQLFFLLLEGDEGEEEGANVAIGEKDRRKRINNTTACSGAC